MITAPRSTPQYRVSWARGRRRGAAARARQHSQHADTPIHGTLGNPLPAPRRAARSAPRLAQRREPWRRRRALRKAERAAGAGRAWPPSTCFRGRRPGRAPPAFRPSHLRPRPSSFLRVAALTCCPNHALLATQPLPGPGSVCGLCPALALDQGCAVAVRSRRRRPVAGRPGSPNRTLLHLGRTQRPPPTHCADHWRMTTSAPRGGAGATPDAPGPRAPARSP